jgi:hypothetical protein
LRRWRVADAALQGAALGEAPGVAEVATFAAWGFGSVQLMTKNDSLPICTVPGCDQPLNGSRVRDPELRQRATAINAYCIVHQRLINSFSAWLHQPRGPGPFYDGFDFDRLALVESVSRTGHVSL